MSEWQPIETAPKDGRSFLIREGCLSPTVAYFCAGKLRHINYQHTNRPTHWKARAADTGPQSSNEADYAE
jgi:hypothetical protein